MTNRAELREMRRITVDDDADGRSTVVEDVEVNPTWQPNGSVLQELWRSDVLPVPRTQGGDCGEPALGVPSGGAVVRAYTMPPDSPDFDAVADLHSGDNLYVITVLDGEIVLVLETESVPLHQGDSVVLPGNLHTMSNTSARSATVLYSAFHMASAPR